MDSDSNEHEMEIENLNNDSASFVNEEKVLQALKALRQLTDIFSNSAKKKPLLEDFAESQIFLQITLKKIPPKRCQKFIKVHLPNSCLTNKTEVCLITGDLDKKDRKAEVDSDVLHYKELLRKEDISAVNEVITLRQLRTEYKPYEAKRKLLGAYDIFLCDKKIAGVLPSTLGKNFYKKRKLPLQINMSDPFYLKKQIDNALSTTRFHITCRGNSIVSEVANFAMTDAEIVENVSAAAEALERGLPGNWNNILGIYIKAAKSKAIPIYLSFDNPSEVNVKASKQRQTPAVGELSTMPGDTIVKVSKEGNIFVKKIEGEEEEEIETEKQIRFKRTLSKNFSTKSKKIKKNKMS